MTLETEVARVANEDPQSALFELAPEWSGKWWGMPTFEMRDARPQQRIAVNFATWDDVTEFAGRLGVSVTRATDTLWFPPPAAFRPNAYYYEGRRPAPR